MNHTEGKTFMTNAQATPGETFLSVDEVVKRLPLGKTTWLVGVKAGKYPQPLRPTPRRPVWRKSDIDALIASF